MSDRLYPARPILAVSTAVFREGQVLIALRANPPAAGVWSLPGGILEAGETLEEGALRELWEEVGVRARIIGFNRHLERIDRDDQGRVRQHFVLAAFVGRWISGEGQVSPEARAVRWVDPDDPGAIETTPALREILARAAQIARLAPDLTTPDVTLGETT